MWENSAYKNNKCEKPLEEFIYGADRMNPHL